MPAPPYPYIYQQLMKGEVIPFLGAGVPLYDRDPGKTTWTSAAAANIAYLPTASELAADLHKMANLPAAEKAELMRAAQYYRYAIGAVPLQQRLSEVFSFKQPPTPVHEFLASVPAPLLIVTTNYDDLMERALDAANKPYHVVVHNTDEKESVLWWKPGAADPAETLPDDLDMPPPHPTFVYKIHGAIDRRPGEHGRYVVTEDDYIQFLGRMTRQRVVPTAFAEPFRSRPFLLLGYGLYDWNLRVLLNSIQSMRGKAAIKSWAIETMPKQVEQKLWEERDVVLFDNLTLKDFLANLKAQGAAGGGAPGGGP
jgi:hypothetical protein